jgi:hypothetical protein
VVGSQIQTAVCDISYQTHQTYQTYDTISAVSFRDNLRDFMHGMAYGRYEREMRLQAAELNDLFLLLCYMEIVGLPNPATLYLLDIYPYLLDQFHLWHRRMGMDRSPLGNLPCC